MINLRFLLVLLFCICVFIVRAEVINGPAPARDKPNGKILFTLQNGEKVECGELKNGWFQISLAVKISKQQYDKGEGLKKGVKLVDLYSKRSIGTVTNDIPADLCAPEPYGNDDYYMEIYVYIPKSAIDIKSIPENTLNAYFKSHEELNIHSLQNFILREGYKNQHIIDKSLPGFSEYCIYESTVIDQSPGYRIGLIFENDDLIAVEHSRPVAIGRFKEYPGFEKNRLLLVKPPEGMATGAFLKKFNQAFSGAD